MRRNRRSPGTAAAPRSPHLRRSPAGRARAERDHRAMMVADCWLLQQVGNEGAVDLDAVERERLQIGERGIAGAEIVHGDATRDSSADAAAPAPRVKSPISTPSVISSSSARAAGPFQQAPGAPCRQGRRAGIAPARLTAMWQRIRPCGVLSAGVAQDPFADGNDAAAFLRHRNEHPAAPRRAPGDASAPAPRNRSSCRRSASAAGNAGRARRARSPGAGSCCKARLSRKLFVHRHFEEADRAARLRLGAEQCGVALETSVEPSAPSCG